MKDKLEIIESRIIHSKKKQKVESGIIHIKKKKDKNRDGLGFDANNQLLEVQQSNFLSLNLLSLKT